MLVKNIYGAILNLSAMKLTYYVAFIMPKTLMAEELW